MYISSADFMTRNTERRIEVACPVFDAECKKKIREILDDCLADNTKGRQLEADGTYSEIEVSDGQKKIDCQQLLMTKAIEEASNSHAIPQNHKLFKERFEELLHKIFK